jgi:mRNA interferase HigB
MRIVAKKALKDFWASHKGAEGPLKAWHAEAKAAHWRGPADVKGRYASASILKGNRVVFNIGGNKHRLVVAIHYASEIVFIRFVGTHAQYDAIDAERI